MKHPMYDFPDICNIVRFVGERVEKDSSKADIVSVVTEKFMNTEDYAELVKRSKQSSYEKELAEKEIKSAIIGMSFIAVTFLAISNRGNVCIDGSKYNWDSPTTRRTIDILTIDQIKYPFPAGAIRLEKSSLFYSYFPNFGGNKDSGLSLHRGSIEGDFTTIELTNDATIGSQMISLHEESKEIIYSVLSILLYISSFKNNHNRVESKNIKAKLNKKKAVPDHKIHMIILKQKPLSEIKHHEGRSWESDKTWIVRGHWRNYNDKVVWIDQYWKGVGKNNFQEKIYGVIE